MLGFLSCLVTTQARDRIREMGLGAVPEVLEVDRQVDSYLLTTPPPSYCPAQTPHSRSWNHVRTSHGALTGHRLLSIRTYEVLTPAPRALGRTRVGNGFSGRAWQHLTALTAPSLRKRTSEELPDFTSQTSSPWPLAKAFRTYRRGLAKGGLGSQIGRQTPKVLQGFEGFGVGGSLAVHLRSSGTVWHIWDSICVRSGNHWEVQHCAWPVNLDASYQLPAVQTFVQTRSLGETSTAQATIFSVVTPPPLIPQGSGAECRLKNECSPGPQP